MRLLRHLVAAVMLVPVAGCMLIAPDFDPLDNCPITGDSACGACIRTNCQYAVNQCCGTEECREGIAAFGDDEHGSTMAALDVCAGGSSACQDELDSARSSQEGAAVTGCVREKCSAECGTTRRPGTTVPPPSTWTCTSPRGTGRCATCIFESCATELTTCCSEGSDSASCAYALRTEMAACTNGDAPGCVRVLESPRTGQEGVVRQCVTDSCADVCYGNGRPHQSCTLQSAGAYCSCRNSSEKSGDECSTEELPKASCYFSSKGCICGHYTCVWDHSDFSRPKCSCSLEHSDFDSQLASGDEACEADTFGKGGPSHDLDPACCLSYRDTACECGFRSCSEDEANVQSCERAPFRREMSDLSTPSCSQ